MIWHANPDTEKPLKFSISTYKSVSVCVFRMSNGRHMAPMHWLSAPQDTERHCTACDLLESAHVSLICWKVSEPTADFVGWLQDIIIRPPVFSGLESHKSPSEVPLDKQLCWSSKALHCKVPARGNTAMPERFEQANDQLLTKLLGRVPVLVGEWSRPWSDSLAIKNYPNNFTTLGQTTKSKDRI